MEAKKILVSQDHVPPSFDIYGNQLSTTKKSSNPPEVRVPSEWARSSPIKSNSELNEQRRKDNCPDLTYDLDGDGVVGGYDLVISKIFDKDGDGKLNEEERRNAEEAIKNGFGSKFTWGCDMSGNKRSFRVIQKRGKVIVDEDFAKVIETYPPFEVKETHVRTKSQLNEERRNEKKERANELQQKWEQYNPAQVERVRARDEFYVENPKFNSLSHRKTEEKLEARRRAGLEEPTLLMKSQEDFSYCKDPAAKTRIEMFENRRNKIVQELESSINFNHKHEAKRILERESKLWNISTDGKTWSDTQQKIKQETLNHYSNQFANRPVGIHGKELPKFQDHKPDYWNEDGNELDISRNLFYQPAIYNNTKFYSGDPLKSYQKVEKKQQDISPKPTAINPHDGTTTPVKIQSRKPWAKDNIIYIQKLVQEKLEAKTSSTNQRAKSQTSRVSRRNEEITAGNERAPRLESLLRERGKTIIGSRAKEAKYLRSGGFVES